ncbi:hypothetical protein DFS34DRAFT_4970 [Phlyctochytrium arcticum]|nr:hypothetical protein DFS34DRAFT_4970 [Phlyctochytrium arcticum]
MAASAPAPIDSSPSPVTLRCRKCRHPLTTSPDQILPPHEPGAGQSAFEYRKRDDIYGIRPVQAPSCQAYFTESLDWIKGIETGDLEGRIQCPKCEVKLGWWSWSGAPCSCGAWISPCFSLHKNKVDEAAVPVVPTH